MKVEKIIGDLWDRRLACPRSMTGETPIPQELPDTVSIAELELGKTWRFQEVIP